MKEEIKEIAIDILKDSIVEYELYIGADPYCNKKDCKAKIVILKAAINKLSQQDNWIKERDKFIEALKEISEGKGKYDLEPLKHADNCIQDMKGIAVKTLEDITSPKDE